LKIEFKAVVVSIVFLLRITDIIRKNSWIINVIMSLK